MAKISDQPEIVDPDSGVTLLGIKTGKTGRLSLQWFLDRFALITGRVTSLEATKTSLTSGLQGLANYSGAEERCRPIVIDQAGGKFLAADTLLGELAGTGVSRMVRRLLGTAAYAIEGYAGSGPRVPFIVDANRGTALGYDTGTGAPYGSWIDRLGGGGGGAATGASVIAIAAADRPVPSATGWNGLIVYGQSNSTGQGNAGAAPVSLSQPYACRTFGGGPRANKPGNSFGGGNVSPGTTTTRLLYEDTANGEGTSASIGESATSSAANYAVQRATERSQATPTTVIFASAPGHGGYSLAQLAKGSAWYQNLIDHITEAKARAIAAGVTYALHAVIFVQGERDTELGTTRAARKAAMLQLQADISTDALAITGQTAPVHLIIDQAPYQVAGTNPNTVLGDFDAANASSRIHMVGNRASAVYNNLSVHLAPLEQWKRGRVFGRAYQQLVFEGRKPDVVWPLSAAVRAGGQVLAIRFRVPTLPLVLDTASLAATTDMGFKVVDDTGTVALSGIQITGGDTVQITLGRTLGANPRLRYALDYLGGGLTIGGGASGNLRDSTADACTLGNTVYTLPHLPPHFELPIYSLEA